MPDTLTSPHVRSLPLVDTSARVQSFVSQQTKFAPTFASEGKAVRVSWEASPVILLEETQQTPAGIGFSSPVLLARAANNDSSPIQEAEKNVDGPSKLKNSKRKKHDINYPERSATRKKVKSLEPIDEHSERLAERRARKAAKRAILRGPRSPEEEQENMLVDGKANDKQVTRKATKSKLPPGLALMQNFSATNVGPSRLTLKASTIGVFNKGKASAMVPVSGKKAKKEILFSESKFLNKKPPQQELSPSPSLSSKKSSSTSEGTAPACVSKFFQLPVIGTNQAMSAITSESPKQQPITLDKPVREESPPWHIELDGANLNSVHDNESIQGSHHSIVHTHHTTKESIIAVPPLNPVPEISSIDPKQLNSPALCPPSIQKNSTHFPCSSSQPRPNFEFGPIPASIRLSPSISECTRTFLFQSDRPFGDGRLRHYPLHTYPEISSLEYVSSDFLAVLQDLGWHPDAGHSSPIGQVGFIQSQGDEDQNTLYPLEGFNEVISLESIPQNHIVFSEEQFHFPQEMVGNAYQGFGEMRDDHEPLYMDPTGDTGFYPVYESVNDNIAYEYGTLSPPPLNQCTTADLNEEQPGMLFYLQGEDIEQSIDEDDLQRMSDGGICDGGPDDDDDEPPNYFQFSEGRALLLGLSEPEHPQNPTQVGSSIDDVERDVARRLQGHWHCNRL